MTGYLALRLKPLAGQLTRDQAVRVALAFAAAAIWLEPMRTNLDYGQINAFLALAILADLALPDRTRAKGALIGVAAGIKLTPAIFAVYLLATRRYRAAATSAATFAATVALSYAAVPGDAAQYWRGSVLDPARVGRIQNVDNQSLLGALARTLHTIHGYPVWLPVALVTAAGGLTLAARAGRRCDEARGFALCAITGLLISPISWSHHWVLALPALLIAIVTARQNPKALAALAAAAVAGWARVISRVPVSGAPLAELSYNAAQLLAANAYVLAGLAALLAEAASQVSTSLRHRALSASSAKQASNEVRASPAIASADSANASRTAARQSST